MPGRISVLVVLFVVLVSSPADALSRWKAAEPSIGLALGSGGAVGLAHIAVLQTFDDLQVKPERIAGSSIGAVIGALYAAGLNAAEIRDIFDQFSGSEFDALSGLVRSENGLGLGDVLEVDISRGGLIDPTGFLDFLAGKIEARTFADLEIPLEIVATDYWSGETVVLKQGDLFAAVRASIAVPGLFSPVRRNGMLLIDGGISNPLPYDLLRDRHNLVVAVDVTGTRSAQRNGELGLTEIYFSAFEIMQQAVIAEKMEQTKPDIYIKPDVTGVRLLHFNRIESVLQQSGEAMQELRRRLSKAAGRPASEGD